MNALRFLCLALSLTRSCFADSMQFLASSPDYSDLSTIPGVRIELKYATSDNFMHENLYGRFRTCYLHKEAAAKLKAALDLLRAGHPGYGLLVYDGLRPRSVQRKMWTRVKDTPSRKYVADPDIGSMHNFGLAVDLTATDAEGKPLDMGAGFDDFRPISQPRYEAKFLKSGQLSQKQWENRKILREAMTAAGFRPISNEWWHFDAMPLKQAKEHFKIVE